MLIVDRRGGAGEIVDLIDLDIERESHVVTHKLELRVLVQMLDIAFAAGKEVVGTKHLVALIEQTVDEMRADKAGAPGHENAFAAVVESGHEGFLCRKIRVNWRLAVL